MPSLQANPTWPNKGAELIVPEDEELVQLNGAVRIKDPRNPRKNTPDARYLCRHLAHSIVANNFGDKTFIAFSSKTGIQITMSLPENDFDSTQPYLNRQTYLFTSTETIGTTLQSIASRLSEDNDTSIWYLASKEHLMALKIEKLKDNNYNIQFYDPNLTNAYLSVLSINIADLANLTLNELLRPEAIKYHFEETEFPYIALYSKESVNAVNGAQPEVVLDVSCPDQVKLPFILTYHLIDRFKSMCQQFTELHLTTPPKISEVMDPLRMISAFFKSQTAIGDGATFSVLEVLRARADNVGSLYTMLAYGHAGGVRAFMNGPINLAMQLCAELSPESKDHQDLKNELYQALSARGTKSCSALNLALQNGHADAVRAFMIGLVNLKNKKLFTELQITCLLLGYDHKNNAGLYLALRDGHTETVIAWMDGLTMLIDLYNLTDDQIIKLVSASNSDNVLSLEEALENGYTKSITAYIQGLLLLHEKRPIEDLVSIENRIDTALPPKAKPWSIFEESPYRKCLQLYKKEMGVKSSTSKSKALIKALIKLDPETRNWALTILILLKNYKRPTDTAKINPVLG